jgi:2-oxoglutarate decarboxylase
MEERQQFGPNVWLIEEMYDEYLRDPASVSDTWKEFFADYRPPGAPGPAPAPASAAPASTSGSAEAARPAVPAAGAGKAAAKGEPASAAAAPESTPLRGADAVIAKHMEESLGVPTATSVRTVPAKLVEVNRNILNRHLARSRGAKVSFTHLIGYAVARALAAMPTMRTTYSSKGGKPAAVRHDHVNLGLAVDVRKPDGSRTLVVPNIKDADTLNFNAFFNAYEEMIRKVSENRLTPDDFAGTTATITNPGMIGTVQSVPRLMAGQSVIVGVGSIGYPAEYQAADPRALARMGVGKVVTLTSTYDHRVIQGAESGEFLRRVHDLLLGENDFYDEVFAAIGVPYVPVRWREDVNPEDDSIEAEEKQARVLQLINMYRVRGHLIAPLDPLQAEPPTMHEELDPATYGLTIWDLDRSFITGGLAGHRTMKLGDVLGIMRDAYCRTATVEYMHMQDPDQKEWIQARMEGVPDAFSSSDRSQILRKLNEAEAFERFLHTKFVGHKRFSLEGAESLIPMLDAVLDAAAGAGIVETVVGMSHRGRLNVLANTVGKSYAQIFREFEGDIDPDVPQGSGDVKYHLGAAGVHRTRDGAQMAVTVASNPSHLEAVDPVIEGIVRAKQDEMGREAHFAVLPLLIHGDAAFAGQGVVAETLNLSQLKGYRTGGTVHIVVNNQVGFTTGGTEARSSTYCTDVAKMVQAPIFHVNGDDPEACVRVARLAFDFRQAFNKDVVIDMWCYRRWGHNEADDPALTQPLMYARIQNRRSVRKLYTETLVNRRDLTIEEAESVLQEFEETLKKAFEETKQPSQTPAIEWKRPAALPDAPVETGVERARLDGALGALTSVPAGFTIHPKLNKWVAARAEALDKDAADWALGESLAFATLLQEGRTVRLAGEDTRRGTFSQRNATLVDPTNGAEHTPLAAIEPGRFFIYDSLLSEFAAMGFEYGYSVANPGALVMWEAQFGDFVNGAQPVIDQFIAAAEDKWGQQSGLVLLLPHGYEGQGPEHSSARIERFLQLFADDNIQVAMPTTPAQLFHLLRRQAYRDIRKPLVVMTPKSLLRHPAARSAASEFEAGHFADVLRDPAVPDPANVSRVLLCAGKVFYDLVKHRDDNEIAGAAIVRLEQIAPFPARLLGEALEPYDAAPEIVWVQEEPENMGAWTFVRANAARHLNLEPSCVARRESASPATGSLKVHTREQEQLIQRAFNGLK